MFRPGSVLGLSFFPIFHGASPSLYIWLALVVATFPLGGFGTPTSFALASDRTVLHHNLTIQMVPDTHEILAHDSITINANDIPLLKSPLRLSLNGNLTIDRVEIAHQAADFDIVTTSRDRSDGQSPVQVIEPSGLDGLPANRPLDISIHYKGIIHDPPRASQDLRFVRPDRTLGHIGPEGIYLTSETVWYPDLPDTLSTFHVQVSLPTGWMAVTQGHQVSQHSNEGTVVTIWEVDTASEALTLVANQFVKHQRDWRGIETATYLFPEDAHLSERYLDATAEYLEVYTDLLGPYPFRKFAVVENFFPSGIGLPSYTLLGSRVIKRGYTQAYSLGHEIVHSWLGNSVLNDFSKGNWVEGLTTYLANYYYEELRGSPDTPLKNRRRMFYEYSLYAPTTEEYPLVQFHHKETRIDNAIGYQKASMVFHMLRREIGDEAFFSGTRSLIKERSGTYADWGTLKQVFEATAGRELGWFFTQWVEETGAPQLRILKVEVHEEDTSGDGVVIELTLEQAASVFQVTIPITIELANGEIHETSIMVKTKTPRVSLPVPRQPTRLFVDPKFEVLRRLRRDQIPPMLNIWVTDQNPVVILPNERFVKDSSVYQPILHRLRPRDISIALHRPEEELMANPNSQLILDDPQNNHLSAKVIEYCRDDFSLDAGRLTIRGQPFEGSNFSWLISCPHPTQPGRTITVFSGFSPSAVSPVARLLFFYGWDSYLVFKDGKIMTRGLLEPNNKDLEVSFQAL